MLPSHLWRAMSLLIVVCIPGVVLGYSHTRSIEYWAVKIGIVVCPREIPQGCPIYADLKLVGQTNQNKSVLYLIFSVSFETCVSLSWHIQVVPHSMSTASTAPKSVQIKTTSVSDKEAMQEMPDTKDCEMWVNGCPLGISVPWCFLNQVVFHHEFRFIPPPTSGANIKKHIFNKKPILTFTYHTGWGVGSIHLPSIFRCGIFPL